jgi:hypothetical protein
MIDPLASFGFNSVWSLPPLAVTGNPIELYLALAHWFWFLNRVQYWKLIQRG